MNDDIKWHCRVAQLISKPISSLPIPHTPLIEEAKRAFDEAGANLARRQVELERFHKYGPKPKKKAGRPALSWRGPSGYQFVSRVESICRKLKCSQKEAIRDALNELRNQQDPLAAQLEKLSDRALAAGYVAARNYWSGANLENPWDIETPQQRYKQAYLAFNIAADRLMDALKTS